MNATVQPLAARYAREALAQAQAADYQPLVVRAERLLAGAG